VNDIDLFEVHDGFSIVEILAMEDLGLCGRGEGADFIFEGHTEISGMHPVNITGGLKAGGHPVGATGVRQIVTLAHSLRSSDKYQTGLAHNVGGVGAQVIIHVLQAL